MTIDSTNPMMDMNTAASKHSLMVFAFGYGGMARSGINDQAGARTQLAGLVTAMFMLLCLAAYETYLQD